MANTNPSRNSPERQFPKPFVMENVVRGIDQFLADIPASISPRLIALYFFTNRA